jgi:hypothetical protein
VGEGAVVGALRMGYVCLQVKDHPVIQTLLQLRNAAGAPLARTHAHTQLRARTRRPQTAPARHATCPETRREIWMPTLNVWYARYAQYSQYPTVPEGAETTQKQHRQAMSSLRFCAQALRSRSFGRWTASSSTRSAPPVLATCACWSARRALRTGPCTRVASGCESK